MNTPGRNDIFIFLLVMVQDSRT